MESNNATREDIYKELVKEDFYLIIAKLEIFAFNLTKGRYVGIEPLDIVSNVLLSVLETDSKKRRNWDKTKCPSFEKFLYWAVKSHVDGLNKKQDNRETAENGHFETYQSISTELETIEELDFATLKNQILLCLQNLGSDALEECVLECWLDGTTKPQDVALFLEISIIDVNNATKRVKRKLPQIQQQLKSLYS